MKKTSINIPKTIFGLSLIIPLALVVVVAIMTIATTEQQESLHAHPKDNISSISSQPTLQEFTMPTGSHPHDVAPAADGRTIWYTAQAAGELARLDPKTGKSHIIALGKGSAPHGVIVGPDGAPWITDGGLNAIIRVDPVTEEVRVFPLPNDGSSSISNANLNTATFDHNGVLWFTGQSGICGRLDPSIGRIQVFNAPSGSGPYGITTTPEGNIYYASLAGNYIARIDMVSHNSIVNDTIYFRCFLFLLSLVLLLFLMI